MIFYFSGVGNSAWAARQLAKALDEKLIFIPDVNLYSDDFTASDDERVGFVFPTYAWGVPTFVEHFIKHVRLQNVNYLYMVTTCGDDTGETGKIFCYDVADRGWTCASAWAVQMPESYVCLPGFEVDSTEKEKKKYDKARQRIQEIILAVKERQTGIFDTLPGPCVWLKSHIVRPFFNRFLITAKPFRTDNRCTGCGRCAKNCPMHNIKMVSATDNHHSPQWDTDCVLCLRCYHSCPEHALHWGRMTKHKGQYLCHIENI